MIAVVAGLAGAGCEPQRAAPVKVMALVQTNQGTFAPKEIQLETISNIVAMEGAAAKLIGGARIVLNFSDPLITATGGNLTEDQIQDVFLKSKGLPPRAAYVEKGGVLWPTDFHTWNMVSLYYNFEQAFKYFQLTRVNATEISKPTAYYFPYFAIAGGEGPELEQKDNTLFASPIRSFAILPFDQLQGIPLAMNQGVIAHEYSHWVLNKRVYDGRAFPQAITQWSGLPQVNILKSLDEGLADFHAYGASCHSVSGCSTRWIEVSVDAVTADDRDIAKTRCIDRSLYTAVGTFTNDQFLSQGLEYRLGTIIAASLYQTSKRVPDSLDAIEQAVVSSYNDANGTAAGMEQLIVGNLNTPNSVALETLLNAIMSHTPSQDIRTEMCNRFLDQLKMNRNLMPDCPNTAVGGTDCPAL
ncbi:MAG TPA: hypothetical protein VND93_01240 [Myxococcales bacterium]|nr:hypothetical protein [Myxococcales bacterium]